MLFLTLACFTAFSASFSLINPLILYSKRDVLQISSLQYLLQRVHPLGHVPYLRKCQLSNILRILFLDPFLSSQTCVIPICGRSDPECVLNLFIPAAQCCLLSNSPLQGSLHASAKKLITLFKSPPLHLPCHYITGFSITHALLYDRL